MNINHTLFIPLTGAVYVSHKSKYNITDRERIRIYVINDDYDCLFHTFPSNYVRTRYGHSRIFFAEATEACTFES